MRVGTCPYMLESCPHLLSDMADQRKLDLDKVQIEGILLGIVRTDLMPKFSSPAKKYGLGPWI